MSLVRLKSKVRIAIPKATILELLLPAFQYAGQPLNPELFDDVYYDKSNEELIFSVAESSSDMQVSATPPGP